jgi:F-type H+-transporting ATPase subunit b
MTATEWASLWAFVSLILFLALMVYLKVPGMLAKALDERAKDIQDQLAKATQLREEAQSLLAEYQRKRKEAEAEAEHIVASAKREAAMLADEAKRKTEEYVERRNQLSENKIKQAEADAINAVRSAAVDLAIAAAQKLSAEKVTGNVSNDLFKNAVEEVKVRLN